MNLNLADPDGFARRHDFNRVADLDLSREERTGDHGTEAADREMTVDRQARRTIFVAWRQIFEDLLNRLTKLFQTLTLQSGNPAAGSLLEKGPFEGLPNLFLDNVDPVFFSKITLGQHQYAARDLQKL